MPNRVERECISCCLGNRPRVTAREREIAELIASGRSNREIAEALVLAVGTVARHVANILQKLDFHSRAQVAAWVVQTRSAVTAA